MKELLIKSLKTLQKKSKARFKHSETSKVRKNLAKYCVGDGIDIGYGGDPIVPHAICVDLPQRYANYQSYPQHLHGDARHLSWFESNSLDFVYSSHVLEDFKNTEAVLSEWLRVLRPGGTLILFLPDEQAYRKYCRQRGKPPNAHHTHEDFSLESVKKLLAKRSDVQIIHERFPSHIYSFELVVRKLGKGHAIDHKPIRPVGTYSPWEKDQTFLETFDTIQNFTLVDKYRCFELWSLVEQAAKLQGAIIEIGVWKGGTGALIAQKAKICKIIDPVYLCDTFNGVVKAGPKDSRYKGGEHGDALRQEVEQLLFKRMHLQGVEILEGIFPEETSQYIDEEQFRFCHIDVDVYQSAKDITEWIWGKMVIGGILVYDDYGFYGCDGITKYVEEQQRLQDRLFIHNLNGHAIIIKLK